MRRISFDGTIGLLKDCPTQSEIDELLTGVATDIKKDIQDVVLQFNNLTNDTLCLCWCDAGELKHYYRLVPGAQHIEISSLGDIFVVLSYPSSISKVFSEHSMCCELLYRPTAKGTGTHCVSISTDHISVESTILEIIDSSWKEYEPADLCGFTIMQEYGVSQACPSFWECLEEDLSAVCSRLSADILELLRDTRIYVNVSLRYGSHESPVFGKGCCFHHAHDWLASNGLSVDKCGHIEIYTAVEYVGDREYYGPGGLILHELAHAYHFKHVKNSFDNMVVKLAYNKAIHDGFYDSVPSQRCNYYQPAYALTSAPEYFAESSVAYFEQDCHEHYSKWFPFNRFYLKDIDPTGYEMCHALWNNPCSD